MTSCSFFERPLVVKGYEVPPWAVVASGESRLEPVCETAGETQESINLTDLIYYCFGRSPSNHIELHHRTSSRRHAIIFHHPNGACYILDCRSAHGTFINGNRLPHATPVRVRRGSLIRFGGPGAPCFILKCFSSTLRKLVGDLRSLGDAFSSARSSQWLLQQKIEKSGIACIRGEEGGIACILDQNDAPNAALVLLNTRLNTYSKGISSLSQSERPNIIKAQEYFDGKIHKASTASPKRKQSEVGLSPDDDDASSVSKKRKVSRPVRSILKVDSMKKQLEMLPEEGVSLARVLFSDYYYPSAVTPDELSLESEGEDDEPAVIINPLLHLTCTGFGGL